MTKALHNGDPDAVAGEIAALSGLTVKQLKERWKAFYGSEASRYISRKLLTGAVAYRLQEQAFGGLTAATRRLLERIGGASPAKLPEPGRHDEARRAPC